MVWKWCPEILFLYLNLTVLHTQVHSSLRRVVRRGQVQPKAQTDDETMVVTLETPIQILSRFGLRIFIQFLNLYIPFTFTPKPNCLASSAIQKYFLGRSGPTQSVTRLLLELPGCSQTWKKRTPWTPWSKFLLILSAKFDNFSAKFGSLNVQIRKNFKNVIFIVYKRCKLNRY